MTLVIRFYDFFCENTLTSGNEFDYNILNVRNLNYSISEIKAFKLFKKFDCKICVLMHENWNDNYFYFIYFIKLLFSHFSLAL